MTNCHYLSLVIEEVHKSSISAPNLSISTSWFAVCISAVICRSYWIDIHAFTVMNTLSVSWWRWIRCLSQERGNEAGIQPERDTGAPCLHIHTQGQCRVANQPTSMFFRRLEKTGVSRWNPHRHGENTHNFTTWAQDQNRGFGKEINKSSK